MNVIAVSSLLLLARIWTSLPLKLSLDPSKKKKNISFYSSFMSKEGKKKVFFLSSDSDFSDSDQIKRKKLSL